MSVARILPANSKSLGNVRPQAQEIRSNGDIPTAEVAESLQDQVDSLHDALKAFSVVTPGPTITDIIISYAE